MKDKEERVRALSRDVVCGDAFASDVSWSEVKESPRRKLRRGQWYHRIVS
jgi:hypothetical protein